MAIFIRETCVCLLVAIGAFAAPVWAWHTMVNAIV